MFIGKKCNAKFISIYHDSNAWILDWKVSFSNSLYSYFTGYYLLKHMQSHNSCCKKWYSIHSFFNMKRQMVLIQSSRKWLILPCHQFTHYLLLHNDSLFHINSVTSPFNRNYLKWLSLVLTCKYKNVLALRECQGFALIVYCAYMLFGE